MTADQAQTVQGRDLRRLLDSDLPDPALVLVSGRVEVVGAGDRRQAGLEIISREAFVRRADQTDFTDAELDQHAAQLTAAVNNLGG